MAARFKWVAALGAKILLVEAHSFNQAALLAYAEAGFHELNQDVNYNNFINR